MRKYNTKTRCRWRDKRISWCLKLAKFCNSPFEYETCTHYEPKSKARTAKNTTKIHEITQAAKPR